MPYIEGFVAAVQKANKAAYIKHATEAAAYFKKLGATRLVKCCGVRSGLRSKQKAPEWAF